MKNQKTLNSQVGAGIYLGTGDQVKTADLLNDLITANRGIVNIYQTAAKRLENEANTELLRDASKKHESFILELSNLVASSGNEPATHANGDSLVKQAWVTLKATVTDGDGPILAEAAQDAENVLGVYGETMSMDLSDDVRKLIGRQMSESRLIHEKLSAMSAVITK